MRIGTSKAINTTQLIFLFLSWSSTGSANIIKDIPKFNPLNIYYDPAPSPEDGPPLSRGALRDPAYLPAEIGGIIGAYVFCVCAVGTALVLIGRRARQNAQRAATARDVEMVTPKPPSYKLDISPLTPGGNENRNFSWPSPEKTDRNPYIFPANNAISIPGSPPGAGSPIDHRIVEADRHMMDRNLEDIYAHVMAQEDAKANGAKIKELPPLAQLAAAGPVPLASPQRQESPAKKFSRSMRRPSTLTIDEPKSPKPHSRTSSIISSLKSPGRKKAPRQLQISSPLQTPMSATFPSNASDEEPLSPRFYYRPPPPPPVPQDEAPYGGHQRNVSNNQNESPTRSIAEQLSYDPLANQQSYNNNNRSITHFQTHRPNPSQTSIRSNSTRGDPLSAISTTSQTPLFPLKPAVGNSSSPRPVRQQPLQLQVAPAAPAAPRALPFRSYEQTPSLASPAFTQTTKTTVLERTMPATPGLNTAGMPRTPWTAGAVPYSPYQPFTPMVPVTPRLVTREERKEMKKREKKIPVMEMIKGEDELWDTAY